MTIDRITGSRIVAGAVFCLLALCAAESAMAQGLNRLVMPGRVVEGHAEFESDCAACHVDDSSNATDMDALCTACHEDVGEDRLTGRGFHGRFPAADSSSCVSCHTDHEGRDADIVPDTAGFFSHEFTDFPLTGAHETADCSGCHLPDTRTRDASTECVDCHLDDDVHDGQLGAECAGCHETDTWSEWEFDHASIGYALTGGHADVTCVDCHGGNNFTGTPTSCGSCHAVDDVHGGSNGASCGDCHTTGTWANLNFNHAAETGFALSDGHSGLECQDCHTREDFKDGLTSACAGCHLADDDHQGRNGDQCADCHVTTEWSESLFAHADTGFVLHDAHQDLQCGACHKSSTTTALPTDCGGCHSLDDNHMGQLGGDCAACHSQTEWHANIAFDHDLSDFPLMGMHAAASCDSCHSSQRFHDAPTDCVSCHADDDVHGGALGTECGDCHTSNEWPVAEFDHGEVTGFTLDGAHDGLTCSSCHSSSTAVGDVPSTCGGCHAADDIHQGQFGMQCQQCHNSTSFSDVDGF